MDTLFALIAWWQANGDTVLTTVGSLLNDVAIIVALASGLAAIINPEWGPKIAKMKAFIDKLALNVRHAKGSKT